MQANGFQPFMHRIVFAILALALAVPSAVAQQPQKATTLPPALSADDETAVQGLVNGFAGAWNRHDMKAMHDLDTDDMEWVNVVGQHWQLSLDEDLRSLFDVIAHDLRCPLEGDEVRYDPPTPRLACNARRLREIDLRRWCHPAWCGSQGPCQCGRAT
jgi:hypothetical protein